MRHPTKLSNILDSTLINCEIELDLSGRKECVLIEHHNNITKVNFISTSIKHYIPVVFLSINDNINILENLQQRFKRRVSCNKYRSEIPTQS